MDEYPIPLSSLSDSSPVAAFGSHRLPFFFLRLIFISSAHLIILALEAETTLETPSVTSQASGCLIPARHAINAYCLIKNTSSFFRLLASFPFFWSLSDCR